MWICAATVLVLCAGVASADSRYAPIVERNVFGLKPIPPPGPPGEEKAPPSNITLTGIITLGGKRALMTTPPSGGKPGASAIPQYYILREGERQGDIEVVSIDEVNFVVKVKNAGQEQSLNFKDNGAKLPAGTPVPPPMPGAPGGMPGQPGFNPGAVARPMPLPGGATTPAGGAPPMPNFERNVRLPSAGNPTAMGDQVNPAFNQSGAAGITPRIGVPGGAPSGAKWPPESNLSLDEQRAMIELMRQKYQQEGNPAANLLPGGGGTPNNGNPQNPRGL